MHSPNQTLIEEEEDGGNLEGGGHGRLRLLVFANETLTTHPLPESGEVVVGRAEEADIRVDLPVISRRHARIRIGRELLIEDLGSSNGTRVHGRQLRSGEQAAVVPGDAVELGSVTLVLQRAPASSGAGRPRRLWTHSYFEARLEEECSRAGQTGSRFALLRVRREPGGSDAAIQEVLAGLIGPTDVIAAYAAGDYEVLLIGQEPARTEELARRIASRLEELDTAVRVAIACYPRDGREPETLVAKVSGELRGTRRPELTGAQPVVVLDPQMQRLHELVRRVAASPISVILMGETGVGKEVFAEAIHRHSNRAQKPFLRLNCAAFSESLLESELFGHEKGAFTGAVKSKVGLLESAQGGTILLDEVGEMPLTIQAKLLRVLEQREVLRVGELRPRSIDVRFIAATNRDLEAESARGTFRRDLFFRLNGVSLHIPPLRERRAEIEGLARALIAQAAQQAGRPEPELSPEALALLQRYAWPGNIRELRNVIDRAVLFADRTIELEHLPVDKMSATLLSAPAQPSISTGSPTARSSPGSPAPEAGGDEPSDAYQAERRRILDALQRCAGNQTEAAKLLGISRRTLLVRLDEYAIPRPRKGVTQPKGE